MFGILNRVGRRTTVEIGHPEDWRIIVDFTGTVRANPLAVVVADLEPDEIERWIRHVARGALVVLCGLEVLPESAESAALLVARAARSARGIDLYCDCSGASPRWHRRFIGNLTRFGCIEPGEAISEQPLPRTGVP